jgi:hypothetical protein
MNHLFNIEFLDETFEFLSHLEKKHYEKILFNIRKAQTRHDPELFKKLIPIDREKFGNSEHFTKGLVIDYSHFGTKPILEIHL